MALQPEGTHLRWITPEGIRLPVRAELRAALDRERDARLVAEARAAELEAARQKAELEIARLQAELRRPRERPQDDSR